VEIRVLPSALLHRLAAQAAPTRIAARAEDEASFRAVAPGVVAMRALLAAAAAYVGRGSGIELRARRGERARETRHRGNGDVREGREAVRLVHRDAGEHLVDLHLGKDRVAQGALRPRQKLVETWCSTVVSSASRAGSRPLQASAK
jgi:hypothetical protein